MRGLIRALFRLLALAGAALVVGRILEAQQPQQADPEAEYFMLAAFFNGKEFKSRAAKLRGGSAKVVFGGVDIDLTAAELDPDGATINLDTTIGGVRVLVPAGWRVELTGEAMLGENSMDVAGQEQLGEDAPQLTVNANTRVGGTLVTSDPAKDLKLAIEI